MTDEVTSVCGACGSSIYKQHLDSGIARHVGGKLLCSHCLKEHEEQKSGDDVFEPIEFDDDDDISSDSSVEDLSSSRIHSATSMGMAAAWDESKYKRPLQPGIDGATRCRTFHCKLSEGALEFMMNQINEWLEANEEIVIKFSNSSIGPFEGKHTEQNIIITVFY